MRVAALGDDGAHPGRAEHRDADQRYCRAIGAARSGWNRAAPMATPKPARRDVATCTSRTATDTWRRMSHAQTCAPEPEGAVGHGQRVHGVAPVDRVPVPAAVFASTNLPRGERLHKARPGSGLARSGHFVGRRSVPT